MSVVFLTSGAKSLKAKPSAWCGVKALAVVGAGAAFWAAVVVILMRATGN